MGETSNGFSWNPLSRKSKNDKSLSLIHFGLCKGVITLTSTTKVIGIWLCHVLVSKYINVTIH